MNAVQYIGAFLSGLILIAALSLIVKPGSSFGNAVSALGDAVAGDISAAKS
jgi:hypothetical protein